MLEIDYVAGNPQLNGTARMVVVSGCSGGGKSALLSEMARRGYEVNPEPGRQIVKEQAYVGGDGLPWANVPKFTALCVSRAVHFYNAARPVDRCVLFDRSIVDAISYLARLGLPVPQDLRHALARYRYAPTVFLTPPWKELFENDAQRRHTFADAVAEYQGLLAAYPANGYAIELIPKAGVEARADFLEERLERLQIQHPDQDR
jgi:predicted ATPase